MRLVESFFISQSWCILMSILLTNNEYHREYIPNFYLLREDFMSLKAFLVTFFKHVLKFSGIFSFFGTAIINHFVKHIYTLFVMFKYIIHHYCAVADVAD